MLYKHFKVLCYHNGPAPNCLTQQMVMMWRKTLVLASLDTNFLPGVHI